MKIIFHNINVLYIYLFIDQTNAALVSIRYFQKCMYLFIVYLFIYFHLTDEKQYIYITG